MKMFDKLSVVRRSLHEVRCERERGGGKVERIAE